MPNTIRRSQNLCTYFCRQATEVLDFLNNAVTVAEFIYRTAEILEHSYVKITHWFTAEVVVETRLQLAAAVAGKQDWQTSVRMFIAVSVTTAVNHH